MESIWYNMFIVFHFIGIRGQLLPDAKSGINLVLYEGSLEVFHSVPIENSKELLELDAYDSTLKSWVYVSGYRGQQNGGCVRAVQQAVIDKKDRNVFYLDNYKHVFLDYIASVELALLDGKLLGKALKNMKDTGKFSLYNTIAAGFSLGCHVIGATGNTLKSLGEELGQIICCDPAAMLFENPAVFPPLNKDCAKYVQVIHTDRENMGMNKSLGKSDFYVNDGIYRSGLPKNEQVQPACPPRDSEMLSPNSLCSHNFCCLLLAQSMKTYIEGGKAASFEAYKNGQIISTSGLGDKVSLSATGDHYVETSGCPPYDLNTVCQNPGAPLTAYCQAAT